MITMSSTTRFLFFYIAFASILSSSHSEYLSVPTSSFVSSLTTAIRVIQEVIPQGSRFNNFLGDPILSRAVSDCHDLLDFSADVLNWSVSAVQNSNGEHYSSGDLSSDLRTWLSAALSNQDTCIEGFSGTQGTATTYTGNKLHDITSIVHDLLTKVNPSPKSTKSHRKMSKKGQFPAWFKREERKLLMGNGVKADVVVAADGTGDFTKIMDAVLAAPDQSLKRFVIYIKSGVYHEYVEISKKKWSLMMVGDGINSTIITGNRNNVDGWKPYNGATFAVNGRGFIARDITFENTAGPGKHQAVALRSDSDLSVFYRCEIRGYQDTLYTHTMRQFFRECEIRGTVDFIFGYGTVVFQKCLILMRKGLPGQKNTITAHGLNDSTHTTGFSIQFCNISADSDLVGSTKTTWSYLGRPWKNYARTVVMQSYISDAIRPEGWLENNGNRVDELEYGEYMNYGPGAGLSGRVKWPGYRALNKTAADYYTVANFIVGDLWLPSTGVTYTRGLDV